MAKSRFNPAHLNKDYYPFLFHYYRAETQRETQWRDRLDVTTNWTIVVTAAIISFVYSREGVPHGVIIVNYLATWFFLYLESRRYRYYHFLKQRTRAIEEKVLAPILEQPGNTQVDAGGLKNLAKSFRHHVSPMGKLEAMAWRIRRTYFLVLTFLLLIWINKLALPESIVLNLNQYFSRSRLWLIPGEIVFAGMFGSWLFAVAIAAYLPQRSQEDDLP